MSRDIWKYELIGIPFIYVIGSMLHFAFAWSGQSRSMALFAAVNESVWEHLKMVFWPSLAWAVFEWRRLKLAAWPFWSAKAYGLLAAPFLIVILFYAYTALLGRNMLVLDIAVFLVAIILGQTLSAVLMARKMMGRLLQPTGLVLLVVQLIAFSIFTYYPPPLGLFEDSRTIVRSP